MSSAERPLAAAGVVRAALVVTAGVALALGTAAGVPGWTVLAVAGAVLFGGATAAVGRERYRWPALGSLALAPAVLAVAAAVWGTSGATSASVGALGLATLAVAVESSTGFTADAGDELADQVVKSLTVIVAGTLLVVGFFVAVVFEVPVGLGSWLLAASTSNVLAAFLSLQVGLAAARGLLALVRAETRAWDIDAGGEALEGGLVGCFAADSGGPSQWFVIAVIAQLILVAIPPVPAFVTDVLAARPVVGSAVDLLLLSGVLQGIVGLTCCLLLGLVALSTLVRFGARWAASSDAPGRTVAVAASGFAAVGVAFAVGILVGTGVATPPTAVWNDPRSVTAFLGSVVAVPAVAAVALVTVGLLFATLRWLLDRTDLAGGGYAVGGAFLFVATAAAANQVHPALVLAGAGAALAVWHLGTYALGVEADLRGVAPSGRAQAVQVTALALALGGGVALALGIGYAVFPLVPAVPTDRALVAVALVLLAVLDFAVVYAKSVPDE